MLEKLKVDISVYYKRKCKKIDILIGFFRIPGFRAILLYRIGHEFFKNDKQISAFLFTRLIRTSCNVDIELGAKIGIGVRMPHPLGIVVGGKVTVGDYCTIMQGVTLGGNAGKELNGVSQPQVGSHVFIGPGAKVLGPVTIGDGASIGANAVVLKNVPSNATAVGVPARILET